MTPFLRLLRCTAPCLAGALLLSACTLPLPDKPVRAESYDFGPSAPTRSGDATSGIPIALAQLESTRALDTTRITYRLAYSDAQMPSVYAHARWTMPPAQLLHQRLRAVLGHKHPIVFVGEGYARMELRVELEEFSQVFDSPSQSHALVRVRATALAPNNRGDRLLGQRSFEVRVPAPTPDAPGGVKALTQASEQISQEIDRWIDTLPVGPKAS